ncbi:MAG: hypothetical protein JKX73_10835 [Flavobacteriales bacterium]|nr:hypothetical protein [Flavobacteriales bacterium]
MLRYIILVILFPLISAFNYVDWDDIEWKLKKSEDGITVYTRESATSSFSELKMHGTFKTTMSSIIALFKDIPNYTAWVYNCTESRSVKSGNDGEDYYYSITSAPWPVSDRDVVVHSKVSQDPVTWIVSSISEHVDGIVEKKDGLERVPLLKSMWTLIPLKGGMVDITYHLTVDPGGLIPVWLSNLTLTIGPYNTMVALRNEIARDKYKNARFRYIFEPFLEKAAN